MPKKTLASVAAEHGLSRDQLNAARTQGIDPWNPDAVAEWATTRRHRIKPGAKLTMPADFQPGEDPAQTLEQMEDAIRRATDIDSVKILKEKVGALKIAVQVRQETKELVGVGEVRQSMTKVVSAARGELLKMSADLPPRVEGLSAPQIQRVIRDSVIEILARLADETSALYAD